MIETVTVKDKSGKPMEGLTAKDFTITEDGVAADHPLFRISEVAGRSRCDAAARARRGDSAVQEVSARQITPETPGATRYRDRRLLALYFDMTAMPLADQFRAFDAARKFIRTQMTSADLMAIMMYHGRRGTSAAGFHGRSRPAAAASSKR